jgi:hypothetical protein
MLDRRTVFAAAAFAAPATFRLLRPALADAEPYIQHGGIKGLRNIFPDLHLTVEDRIFGGDKIVARNTWTATHRGAFLGIEPTGKHVTFTTIDIWRVVGGKLAEHWDVIDIAGLQKQLGGG